MGVGLGAGGGVAVWDPGSPYSAGVRLKACLFPGRRESIANTKVPAS